MLRTCREHCLSNSLVFINSQRLYSADTNLILYIAHPEKYPLGIWMGRIAWRATHKCLCPSLTLLLNLDRKMCYWLLNIILRHFMWSHDITCLTRPDLTEEASLDLMYVNNSVSSSKVSGRDPEYFWDKTRQLHFLTDAIFGCFCKIQKWIKDVPRGQSGVRSFSGPPLLDITGCLSVMRRQQRAGLSRPGRQKDPAAPTQKPLSLITSPTEHFTVSCSLLFIILPYGAGVHRASWHVRSCVSKHDTHLTLFHVSEVAQQYWTDIFFKFDYSVIGRVKSWILVLRSHKKKKYKD